MIDTPAIMSRYMSIPLHLSPLREVMISGLRGMSGTSARYWFQSDTDAQQLRLGLRALQKDRSVNVLRCIEQGNSYIWYSVLCANLATVMSLGRGTYFTRLRRSSQKVLCRAHALVESSPLATSRTFITSNSRGSDK